VSLAVITYLWSPDANSKLAAPYTPEDVRKLARAVKANLTVPHSFICVTDRPEAFDGDTEIRAIPIDDTIPMDAGHCVCRLMTFHPNGREIFGVDRVFQMDLDTLVIRNFDDVVMRDEPIVLWRNPARVPWDNPSVPQRPYYNGSFVLHRCGSADWTWTEYVAHVAEQPAHPVLKDDQTWLSSYLGPHMPYFDASHGIYRIARPGEPETGIWGDLPDNAKLVTTPGSEGKPENPVVREANPWLERYYPRKQWQGVSLHSHPDQKRRFGTWT
jgi:hypothetical protein